MPRLVLAERHHFQNPNDLKPLAEAFGYTLIPNDGNNAVRAIVGKSETQLLVLCDSAATLSAVARLNGFEVWELYMESTSWDGPKVMRSRKVESL